MKIYDLAFTAERLSSPAKFAEGLLDSFKDGIGYLPYITDEDGERCEFICRCSLNMAEGEREMLIAELMDIDPTVNADAPFAEDVGMRYKRLVCLKDIGAPRTVINNEYSLFIFAKLLNRFVDDTELIRLWDRGGFRNYTGTEE